MKEMVFDLDFKSKKLTRGGHEEKKGIVLTEDKKEESTECTLGWGMSDKVFGYNVEYICAR